MKVIKHKYYDEFWGAKYPYYEYDFEFEFEDDEKIIEETINKIIEETDPKKMKECITFLGDDDEYYDVEINLTNYINDAYKEIIKHKNKYKYFDNKKDFLDWQKVAKEIYKKYLIQ